MNQRCPFCGSSDIEVLQNASPRSAPGASRRTRNRAPENIPALHCRRCGKDFGRPPYCRRRAGQPRESIPPLYPDVLTAIEFAQGSVFGNSYSVSLYRIDPTLHFFTYFPEQLDYEKWEPDYLPLSRKRWGLVVNTLFYQLYVHEWKQRYEDPGLLGGTYWSLELTMEDRYHHRILGSNDCPPLFDDLVELFRPFRKLKKVSYS